MKLVSFVHEKSEIIKNSTGEKVTVLREWNCLLSAQKIALRRQSIGRADWEKLPWTGHLCLLFTRAWEMGRMLTLAKKEGRIQSMNNFLDTCRRYGQIGCEVKFPHKVGKKVSTSTETIGVSHFCFMSVA